MNKTTLKVARIGNSRGVRIPAITLERYRIGDHVIMEEREDGILLRPLRAPGQKLSWDDTARDMARTAEDWSAWDESVTDGLEQTPWDAPSKTKPALRRVAESTKSYVVDKPRRKPSST